ncbi:MAG TPA: 16S rRNA (cytosine(967)-C(5))-methyltransferase RsmB, partial [Proteobacteria bacterium]|nr:16S rRNA (cytosine(967)-C(5))-methyltransferase RsmB [Pseudomonadota bacterium]
MAKAKPALIRRIAVDVLARAEKYRSFVNIVLDSRFKRYRHLTPQDRSIITEIVYGTLRNQRLLDFIISRFSKVKPSRMERRTLLALRIGAYQVLFMRRIPHALAVNESVGLAAPRSRALVNAVLRSICRARGHVDELLDGELAALETVERLAVRYSHPDWIVRMWIDRFGKEFTEGWLAANNTPAPLYVRVNTIRTTAAELAQRLVEAGLNAEPCG